MHCPTAATLSISKSAQQFIDELKQMVNDIVLKVLRDDSDRRKISSSIPSATINNSNSNSSNNTSVTVNSNNSGSNNSGSSNASTADSIIGQPCPLCGKGRIIKGRTAYGCSEWKSGCGWRKAF